MTKEADTRNLSEREQAKPIIRVSDLIAHIQTLPQDYEIILYPKYFDWDSKFGYARPELSNIGEAQSQEGHHYCRIVF